MTRKHFQMVADVIAASPITAMLTDTQREDLAYEFARKLATENARFDVRRFFAACGIDADNQFAMAQQFSEGYVTFDPKRG